jgi:GntP family gluconate:H+ symporter
MISPSVAALGLTAHPFLILGLSIALVVLLIGVCRVHAFFALIGAAAAVALMTAGDRGLAASIDAMLREFGASVGGIGYSIAAAAVIGAALMESGAADRIVRSFLAVLGEQRAPLALLGAAFVLGVPVFFDTVFFLLVPLARALTARTGKNYMLHLLAICAGSVITHATVPPTPGPLAVAEILKLDLGLVLVVGLAAGVPPALGGLWFARWTDRRRPVELRAAPGSSVEHVTAIAHRDASELPGFGVSIAPVVLPLVLIGAASVAGAFRASVPPALLEATLLLGNKNVALTLAALAAVAVYLRQKKLPWRQTEAVVGEPLATAGAIILITAAGGAYGAMLKQSGIGEAIRGWAGGSGLGAVALAWGLAALLRAAQGSTTVAVITTAGLVMSMGGAATFGVHPIVLYLAIGYGGLCLSWMNDSGFWIFSRMTGLTERETLRSWTVLLTLISVLGLAEALVLALVLSP